MLLIPTDPEMGGTKMKCWTTWASQTEHNGLPHSGSLSFKKILLESLPPNLFHLKFVSSKTTSAKFGLVSLPCSSFHSFSFIHFMICLSLNKAVVLVCTGQSYLHLRDNRSSHNCLSLLKGRRFVSMVSDRQFCQPNLCICQSQGLQMLWRTKSRLSIVVQTIWLYRQCQKKLKAFQSSVSLHLAPQL